MAVVAFNFVQWATRFPELAATVAQPQATLFFAEAGLYLDNTDCSQVQDVTTRGLILNLITAHIAALSVRATTTPVVGRINNAAEGSVSVGTEYQVPGSAAWFAQTPYGASAWQALAGYRTARYVPGPQRNMQPYGVPFFTAR